MDDSRRQPAIRRPLLALGVALCAFGLIACGGGSDEDKIRDVVAEFSEKAKARDESACDLVSFSVSAQQGGKALCEGFIKGGVFQGQKEDPPVEDIEVDGDNATAKVDGREVSFVKEDGDWKLGGGPGFGGGARPPATPPNIPTTPSVPEGIPTSPDQIPTQP
jgi:hypothetical protein